MTLLSQQHVLTLMEKRPGYHVSMYMPMHRAGVETLQNSVRCRNLLRQAEEHLLQSGMPPSQANALLEPVTQRLGDYTFWQHQSDGLAVFLAPGVCEMHCLPVPFDELVVVNQRFHLKPLLPWLSEDGRFYVLTLSQNDIRLLQCTRYSVAEVELPDVPKSRDEALKYNDPERQQQFHTETQPFGHPTSGERGAIFYGTGDDSHDPKGLIVEFFRIVDRGLHEVLRNEQAPLVLAGVEYLWPRYKEVATYAHVVEAGIPGNVDGLRAEALQAKAWPLVEPLFRQARQDAEARYRRYIGTGRATYDLQEVVRAAHHGRVETLFVATGMQCWGTFIPETQDVTLAQEGTQEHEDLLDYAAFQTLLNSGTVYAVSPDEVPDHAPLAAILRY